MDFWYDFFQWAVLRGVGRRVDLCRCLVVGFVGLVVYVIVYGRVLSAVECVLVGTWFFRRLFYGYEAFFFLWFSVTISVFFFTRVGSGVVYRDYYFGSGRTFLVCVFYFYSRFYVAVCFAGVLGPLYVSSMWFGRYRVWFVCRFGTSSSYAVR